MLSVDYIIVGGGSTGSVLAGRLSEDAACSVALLEEGPHDRSPWIHIPGAYYKTAQGNLLKRYHWEIIASDAFLVRRNGVLQVEDLGISL